MNQCTGRITEVHMLIDGTLVRCSIFYRQRRLRTQHKAKYSIRWSQCSVVDQSEKAL